MTRMLPLILLTFIHATYAKSVPSDFTIQGNGKYEAGKLVVDIHIESNGVNTTTVPPTTAPSVTSPMTATPGSGPTTAAASTTTQSSTPTQAQTPTTKPSETSAATPMPGQTSAATPKPGQTSAATPKPGQTSAATPKPGQTSAATPKPGQTSATTPNPGQTSAATPKPGQTSATTPKPGQTSAATPKPGQTSATTPKQTPTQATNPPQTPTQTTKPPQTTGPETPAPGQTPTSTPEPTEMPASTPKPGQTPTTTPQATPTPNPSGSSSETGSVTTVPTAKFGINITLNVTNTTTAAPGEGVNITNPTPAPERYIDEAESSANSKIFSELDRTALELHNYYRSIHEAPLLNLDVNLRQDAQEYAKRVAKSKLLRPEQDFVLISKNEGENLGFRCSVTRPDPARALRQIMKRWYDEGCKYNFQAPASDKYSYRHFTQLTWNGSKSLGVGIAYGQVNKLQCLYFVARYRPRGNIKLKYVNNVKKGVFDSSFCKPIVNQPSSQEVILKD